MEYADTGFLLSLYLAESTTAAAATAMRAATLPLPLIPLTLLELRNGFRLAVFRQTITEDERAQCWEHLEQDLAAGVYDRAAVPQPALYDRAVRLVDAHSAHLGTRTLDVLHVAAASVLGVKKFLSFDRRQRALARAAGLRVAP